MLRCGDARHNHEAIPLILAKDGGCWIPRDGRSDDADFARVWFVGVPAFYILPVAFAAGGITAVGASNPTLVSLLETLAASVSGAVTGTAVAFSLVGLSLNINPSGALGFATSVGSIPVLTVLGAVVGYQLTSNWRLRRMREQLTSPRTQLTWAISPTQGDVFAGVGLRF